MSELTAIKLPDGTVLQPPYVTEILTSIEETKLFRYRFELDAWVYTYDTENEAISNRNAILRALGLPEDPLIPEPVYPERPRKKSFLEKLFKGFRS